MYETFQNKFSAEIVPVKWLWLSRSSRNSPPMGCKLQKTSRTSERSPVKPWSSRPQTRLTVEAALWKICASQNGWISSPNGCFLKWWYPQNTPKSSFLVGKPMVVGYHHFRKPPNRDENKKWFATWDVFSAVIDFYSPKVRWTYHQHRELRKTLGTLGTRRRQVIPSLKLTAKAPKNGSFPF